MYCVYDVDGICEKTNGVCILDNPKTLEDYKKCPKRKISKHFNEMTREEKNIVIGTQNKKNIEKILGILEKIERDNKKRDTRIESLTAGDAALTSRLYVLENGRKESIFVRMKKWLSWKK